MRKMMSLLLCMGILMTLAHPVSAQENPEEQIQNVSETTATVPTSTTPAITPPAEPTTPPETSAPAVPAQCSHNWGSGVGTDATCTQEGSKTFTCSLCGGTRTETTPAAGHKFGEWSATAEAHSRTCTVCQTAESGSHAIVESVTQQPTCKEPGVYAEYCATCNYIIYEELPKLTTHTYDNNCDPDCNVCEAVREIKHDLQQWWSKGASGHWHTCTKCGYQGDFGKHYPGPAATEDAAQICLTCNYTLTPQLSHEHDYVQTWSSDESGHWYACSGCEDQKDLMPHEFDNLCDSDCNVCGFKNDSAHSFDGSWHSDDEGHWFVCVTCGSVVESKEHVAPESTPEGEAVYCVSCGYLMAEAAGHTHVYAESWNRDDSQHWRECSCGNATDAATHNWSSGEKDKDGNLVYTCSVCQASYSQKAPADQTEDFPWMIVFVVLVIALLAAIVTLILVLKPKKGKFTN